MLTGGHRARALDAPLFAPDTIAVSCAPPCRLQRSPACRGPYPAHRGRYGLLQPFYGSRVDSVHLRLQVSPEEEIQWGQIRIV